VRAVVTAGGTREPVDDVRVLTNLSTGRLGAACANALARAGCQVTLLAAHSLASRPDWLDPRIAVVPFGSTAELHAALLAATQTPPDALLMAAAVADYTPARAAGKLRSQAQTMTLTLTRTPKLLAGLRDRCPDTLLVGFKLLSGVSEETLIETARRQVVDNRLDLCLANDLQDLVGSEHPAWIVPDEGPLVHVQGGKEQTAEALVQAVLARRWPADGPDAWGPLRAVATIHDAQSVQPAAARLLSGVPGLGAVLELPEAIVLPSAPGVVPWTGDPRDASQLTATVARQAWLSGTGAGGFALHLAGGADLVGVTLGAMRFLPTMWRDTVAAWRAALAQAGIPAAGAPLPVFDADRIIGACTRKQTEFGDAWAVWLRPDARGSGHGDRVVAELSAQHRPTWVHDRCGRADWFAERGFQPGARDGEAEVYLPPSMREDLIDAASVCLLDPVRHSVLLGRRLGGPWEGSWAFPGGRSQSPETPLQAGLRVLERETGIALDEAVPLQQHTVVVGAGSSGFRVSCLVIPVIDAPQPEATDAMDAAWVPLRQMEHLRPMTAGTRRVLRHLCAHEPVRRGGGSGLA